MAQYIPQQGDDFMSFNSGPTDSGYGNQNMDPNYMNPHDSQQSYNTNFLDMGDQSSYNSGYQDQNYNQQGAGYGGGDPNFDQGSYGGDSSFVGGHPSTTGDSSFVGGHPSTTGDSSFVGGHPSTQGGDSSFVGGHPSTQAGDSSFVGGHPSTQAGDSSFVGGKPSNQSGRRSPPGIAAPERNAFDSSVDAPRGPNMQVERITEAISRETQGHVDGFAATLRVLAELARRERTFAAGQRFAWRFITLAEAAEAGGDPSSAAMRDAGEPAQNRILVEVHGMLGGRGSNIADELESLERDARLDASEDWGVDSPVNALTESQGIAFDQVELNRRGPIPALADGLRRLGTPVRRGAGGTQGGQAGATHGSQPNTSGQGGSTPGRPAAGRGAGGRGPSPSPRGGGASRGRGGAAGGPVFKSTGQQGI